MRRIHWGLCVGAVLGVATLMAMAACLLPDDPYQRFRSLDGTMYGTLRWTYERIHFDPRPIDVAIVGPSRTLLGLSATATERRLSLLGKPANVANFSILAAGRNINWLAVNEVFKAKSPKIIVVGIDEDAHPWGHPAFKYVSDSKNIIFTPSIFLHNYIYDVSYLPFRQLKLFPKYIGSNFFGIDGNFSRDYYLREPSDYSYSNYMPDGKWNDMGKSWPAATLISQEHIANHSKKKEILPSVISSRLTGDDHDYIVKIARLATAHNTKIIFVYMPTFNGPPTVSDREFIEKYGTLINNYDISKRPEFFSDWAHLNRAGAEVVSNRLADAIAAQSM